MCSALWRAASPHRLCGERVGRIVADASQLGHATPERTAVFYWLLKYVVLGPLLKLIFRPQVEGLDNVPVTGPAILASNHLSFSDSIFMPLVVPRKVTFVAKAEYFTGKGIKGWLKKMFFVGTGTIPVDRSGGRAAQAALDTQLRVLRAGELAGIYPEGTRSPDGRLYRGKTGVARLALDSGAPVIPVAMLNADQVQPIGKVLPRIMRVRIRFGAPLDFGRYAGMAGDRFVERAVTDEIMYELMELTGREYVDVYAAKVKAAQTLAA
jgi:1-acyl-sn-glycerol-3-phosphate acyltransferase